MKPHPQWIPPDIPMFESPWRGSGTEYDHTSCCTSDTGSLQKRTWLKLQQQNQDLPWHPRDRHGSAKHMGLLELRKACWEPVRSWTAQIIQWGSGPNQQVGHEVKELPQPHTEDPKGKWCSQPHLGQQTGEISTKNRWTHHCGYAESIYC